VAGLGFIDAETITAVTAISLGNVAPGSSDDSGVWITNDSDYRAEDVTVTVSAVNDGDQLWLSLDGDSFSASIDVGDVAPGGASVPFWIRRVTASTDPIGGCSGTVVATPAAWTIPIDTSTSDNIPLTEE
jgi:hypothetical protein